MAQQVDLQSERLVKKTQHVTRALAEPRDKIPRTAKLSYLPSRATTRLTIIATTSYSNRLTNIVAIKKLNSLKDTREHQKYEYQTPSCV
jgi:hypothetical protein